MPGAQTQNRTVVGSEVTVIHTAYTRLALPLCWLWFTWRAPKSGTLLRKKGEERCKMRETWKWGKKREEVNKNIKMDANYTKRSGKGRASLVAGSACKFDLPGSLPYTALSILISCNPVATSKTNQTAESSLFLIRKAQGNHLTLVSQWAPSCLHRKKYPGYDSCIHTLILTFDGLCLKFLLKYFNYTSVWFKNVLEGFSLYSQRIKYPSSETCKKQTPIDYPSPPEPIADPNPFNTIRGVSPVPKLEERDLGTRNGNSHWSPADLQAMAWYCGLHMLVPATPQCRSGRQDPAAAKLQKHPYTSSVLASLSPFNPGASKTLCNAMVHCRVLVGWS